MKSVIINDQAEILNGILAGSTGLVVSFYSIENQVEIEIDGYTTVLTPSENIRQDGGSTE